MKKSIVYLFVTLFCGISAFTQVWQQTTSTPEGGGVTEIVQLSATTIYVTTASYNWPNGDDGGIRRSTNGGESWENVFDAFTGRTITAGADGNLYASIWPYPSAEGLYRSSDNGDTWQLLVTVPTGNNIFSITVSTSTNPVIIFAGTRQGVYRSIDNGINWAYASSGIPANSWVRDIEVDSSGMVVAATTSGLFSSETNGDLWEQCIGGGIENDTITKISFNYGLNKKFGNTQLLGGSSDGNLYEAFRDSKYLTAALLAIFNDVEMSGVFSIYLASENKKMHGVSFFPSGTQPSAGFHKSENNSATWQQNNNGLPGTAPPVSALTATSTNTEINATAGLFQNMNGGAKVFKIIYPWSIISAVGNNEEIPSNGIKLSQNFPNPFCNTTTITYELLNTNPVSLKVFTPEGRLVSTFSESRQTKGVHYFTINGGNLRSGIYYYQLESAGLQKIRKMVLIK